MEDFFIGASLSLFLLAIGTMVMIVREALPFLDSEDQTTLRDYWKSMGRFGSWRKRDRAIKHAWSKHTESFPKSHKRLLFAAFLIIAALSVMFYPLWLALSPR
jgi:hypothetical protein